MVTDEAIGAETKMSDEREVVAIALESGARKVFATALDWPGWCRSGRDEAGAVDALLGRAPRYRTVADRAGIRFPARPRAHVVEWLQGGTGTDFGAPGVAAAAESRPTTAADCVRLTALLEACWAVFDEIAAASPETLRKGPRGGGRDRSQIVEHVVEAERGAYARRLGVRHKPFAADDVAARDALRAELVTVLRRPSDGSPVVDRGWTPRFAARYMAWHVLDHAWEIEDRRER